MTKAMGDEKFMEVMMKRISASLVLIVFVLIGNIFCSSVLADEDTYSVYYSTVRDDRSAYGSYGNLILKQYYDTVVLNESDDECVRINELIRRDRDKFKQSWDDCIWQTNEYPPQYQDCYCNYTDAEVTNNSNGIFSIKMKSYWFMGGVGNENTYGLNYNLNTGEVLDLTDVFSISKSEIENYFKEEVVNYINSHPNMLWWNDEYQNAINTVRSYTLSKFNYYIQGNNVVLCFPVYELGPGAMGSVTVECPIINNGGVKVYLNDNEVEFDQRPVIINGRTLVPLRAIFEAMGATVNWNEYTRTISSVKGSITIELSIGSNVLYKNGESMYLDVPAQIINGRTMVPVRAITEAFGGVIIWDPETREVFINSYSDDDYYSDADFYNDEEYDLYEAFIDNVVGWNSDYLYFCPDDYDGDGRMEAFGITGTGVVEEIQYDVSIWFIDSDGNCYLAKSDLYGTLAVPIDVYGGRFLSWCITGGGSGTGSILLGVKDGYFYEPDVSGKYAGFVEKWSNPGFAFYDDDDFYDLDCEYIGYESYYGIGGRHMWEPIPFEYDDESGEFIEID